MAAASGQGTMAVALSKSRLLTIRIGEDARARPAAQPRVGGQILARLSRGSTEPMLVTRRSNGGGTLTLYGLRDGAWKPSAPPIHVGVGPQLGGPVPDGRDVVIPVVQATATEWPLRVVRLSGGKLRVGPSINDGNGSAQGVLAPTGAHPIAIWQQHGAARGRTFQARIYIKALDGAAGAGTSAQTVWSGYDIGPGDVAVQTYQHRLWALTTRARPGHVDKALRVYVSPVAAP